MSVERRDFYHDAPPSAVEELAVGGVWEGPGIELRHDVEQDDFLGIGAPCPHALNLRQIEVDYGEGRIEPRRVWTVPRVLVAYNEGGHCTTGACLDCAADAALRPIPRKHRWAPWSRGAVRACLDCGTGAPDAPGTCPGAPS